MEAMWLLLIPSGFQKKDEYKAGPYPEGVAVNRGYLYVANSDYGNGNASISVINLSTKATTEIKNENIRNPQEIAVAGSDIYYLDWGAYGPASHLCARACWCVPYLR